MYNYGWLRLIILNDRPQKKGACMILISKIKTEGLKTGFLTRSQIEGLTGGLIKKTYLANADWAGTGIKGRILFGKRVVYPVNDVIGWIEKKMGK